jgi:hypothetical protein
MSTANKIPQKPVQFKVMTRRAHAVPRTLQLKTQVSQKPLASNPLPAAPVALRGGKPQVAPATPPLTPRGVQRNSETAGVASVRVDNHRLQPVPRCLQLKAAEARQMKSTEVVRLASRPNPAPQVSQAKTKTLPPASNKIDAPQTRVPATQPSGSSHKTVQRFASRIVQATKFYPNLHPGAVESVERSNIFRLASFAGQYRLHKVNSHGVNVPNQQYNFVRTQEGEMLLHSRYRHPSIAEGKHVLYAGEIFFNNGKLQWWSNGSGHYQPDVEDAQQANLPLDHFFSYQQIIKGEHLRKKG